MEYQQIFKNIDGFGDEYQISNFGIVRSYKYNEWRVLKQCLSGKGKKRYMALTLCKNCKSKRFYIHRLVAIAFIENKANLPEVNHIDGNKINNHKYNLEWVTGVDNMKHAREKLGFINKGEHSSSAKLTEDNVRMIIELSKKGISNKKIAAKFNIHSGHVWGLVHRKFWKHLKIA